MGQKCIQILVGKSEGKRCLGSPKYAWEVNIKMDLEEIELEARAGLF
jgi:hypothetical protein